MSVNVVVIEDHIELRDMLAILINGNNNFNCIGKFENAEDAIIQIPQLNPDVVLVDIHLPGKSGIYCIEQLKRICNNTKFVICTSFENSESVFEALKAGADGYILKSSAPVKILEAITDAYEGGAPMSSQIARKVVSYFQKQEIKINTELEKLSLREQEILQYLSKGYRYKEISGFLFISIETVRKHIHNIYEKLQVSSRTDALNKISGGNNSSF